MNICIITVVKPIFTSFHRQDPAGTSGGDKSAHPQAPTHRDTDTDTPTSPKARLNYIMVVVTCLECWKLITANINSLKTSMDTDTIHSPLKTSSKSGNQRVLRRLTLKEPFMRAKFTWKGNTLLSEVYAVYAG